MHHRNIAHLILFPSLWNASGFDPSFMNFILENRKISPPSTTTFANPEQSFLTTQLNTARLSTLHFKSKTTEHFEEKPSGNGNLTSVAVGTTFLKITHLLVIQEIETETEIGISNLKERKSVCYSNDQILTPT